MDPTYEQELPRLWSIIADLSEQLNQHRTQTASLHAQAGGIKSQAVHSQTGFVIRRFNLDKPKEEYDAELERMNAAVSAENLALQHDNKQLNALTKDYEQTLETLMTAFRKRAHEVQEHELNLIRDYESALIAKESEVISEDLKKDMALSMSIASLGQNLRKTMRALNGEDPELLEGNGSEDGSADVDWALERDCELVRLERENVELRRMLGIDVSETSPIVEQQRFLPPDASRAFPSISRSQRKILGGPKGEVGPFGTLKRH